MGDDYDAFGRKAGEDPLEGLGWSRPESHPSPVPVEPSEGWSRPPSIPIPADPSDRPSGPAPLRVAPPRPQAPPGRPPRRRRSRAGIVIVGIITSVALVILLAIGGIVYSVTDSVRDVADSPVLRPNVGPPGTVGGGDDERPAPPDKPPRGLGRGSLIVAKNLDLALRSLRAESDGQIKSLRVAPDRIDAQLITRRGYIHHSQVTYTGGVTKGTRTGPGFDATSAIPYSRIDTKAPQKLVRAAAARMRRSPNGIDYLAVMEIGDGLLWSAFFKNGAIYQGDGQGRIVRRAN